MKTTEEFKRVIEEGLRLRAFTDNQLAEALRKPKKNMKECIDYVLSTVKSSGASGFDDEEIFNMAKHYFFEDDVKAKPFTTNFQIITNQAKSLTKEEKAKLKEEAVKQVIDEEKASMRKKPVKPVTAKDVKKQQGKDPQKELF